MSEGIAEDIAKVKLNATTTVVVKRLTIAEIREAAKLFASNSSAADGSYDKLLREHVHLEDGSKLDPEQLTFNQAQKLVAEMVGIPEGSGISDFIGLLC